MQFSTRSPTILLIDAFLLRKMVRKKLFYSSMKSSNRSTKSEIPSKICFAILSSYTYTFDVTHALLGTSKNIEVSGVTRFRLPRIGRKNISRLTKEPLKNGLFSLWRRQLRAGVPAQSTLIYSNKPGCRLSLFSARCFLATEKIFPFFRGSLK